MAFTVYILCAITSLMCTLLLGRAYIRNRAPLLYWSFICFAGLSLANILIFIDLVLAPHTDLSMYRNAVTLISITSLVYGLIIKAE